MLDSTIIIDDNTLDKIKVDATEPDDARIVMQE
jgi:hypothetical protein